MRVRHGWPGRFKLFKQKRVPISLLHLPDELLLQVIEDLGHTELYALSVQCKRLQRICLPPYLLCLGVTTPLIFPIDHLVITLNQFHYPGIPLAFFAKKIRRLSCDIRRPRSVAQASSALQRLSSMVINIDDMEDLALNFKDWYFNSFIDQDLTAQACIHLLEVVAGRCTRLALSRTYDTPRYGWTSYHDELIEKEATEWKGRPPPKGPFNMLSFGTLRSRSSHIPEIYPHRSCNLKTLIFESDTFLLPPFSGWAIKVLNTAPLTRLDLLDVFLHGSATVIFGALTIPTLEHFRVISCPFGLNFNALAKFLSRHDTISTFEFISPPGCVRQLPLTTLPSLVSLKSNASDIGHLLAHVDAFPKLSHVRMVSPDETSMSDVEKSLARAAKRLTRMGIRLCLEVPSTSPRDLVYLPPNPYDISNYPVLSRVREIAFNFSRPDEHPTTSIPSWLSKFPLLEHIELLNMPTGLDHEVKTSFLRSIAHVCTGIRTVKIGDDTRDISVWLFTDS